MSITAFSGRVTQDPELKFGPSGKAVTSLNVAENHRRKNQQTGEWEDSGTTWLRVTLFGAQAENAVEQVRKGTLVNGHGRQETREFTKQDGQRGSSLEVVADEIGVTIPRWAPKHQQSQQAPQQSWGGQQPASQPTWDQVPTQQVPWG